MKTCTKCKTEKAEIEFYKQRRAKDGLYPFCIPCAKSSKKEWYQKNLEYCLNQKKQDRLLNPEKHKAIRKKWDNANRDKKNAERRAYYAKNREKCLISSYRRKVERMATDPLYKLRNQVGTLVGNAIRKNGYSKRSKTRQIIGIDYDCFLQHLIQTAIKNYGVYDSSISYHIDHIYPCSLAKDEAELLRLQHYTNLQFLLPSDNISKSNKVVNDFNCTR